jgi:hypothetical protein
VAEGSDEGRSQPSREAQGAAGDRHRVRVIPFSQAREAIARGAASLPYIEGGQPQGGSGPMLPGGAVPPRERGGARGGMPQARAVTLRPHEGFRYCFRDDDLGKEFVDTLTDFVKLSGVSSSRTAVGLSLVPREEFEEPAFIQSFAATLQVMLAKMESDVTLEFVHQRPNGSPLHCSVNRFSARLAGNGTIAVQWLDRQLHQWRNVPVDVQLLTRLHAALAGKLNVALARGGAIVVETSDPQCDGDLDKILEILRDEGSDCLVVCGFKAQRCRNGCSLVRKGGIVPVSLERMVQEWYAMVRNEFPALRRD